jgi:hypothetical protein
MIERTFLNGFHKVMRLPGGAPIYDGYLVDVGPAMLRINQCSQDVVANDRRNLLRNLDVPVISIVSEGDMWLGVHTRQPNVLGRRAGLVIYEIAGAAHGSGLARAGRASPQEAARSGALSANLSLGNMIPNNFPRGYITRAALQNLQQWVIQGRLPPIAPPLATRGTEIARDADGNALAGVRSVWIDVPTASYQGSLGLGAMAVIGRKTPYAPEKLRTLYPTSSDYSARVRLSVEESVRERMILAEDANGIVESLLAPAP